MHTADAAVNSRARVEWGGGTFDGGGVAAVWTLERFFLGVGPEVGHQRVPELEDLVAELTGEDLQLAFDQTWRRGGGGYIGQPCISGSVMFRGPMVNG